MVQSEPYAMINSAVNLVNSRESSKTRKAQLQVSLRGWCREGQVMVRLNQRFDPRVVLKFEWILGK